MYFPVNFAKLSRISLLTEQLRCLPLSWIFRIYDIHKYGLSLFVYFLLGIVSRFHFEKHPSPRYSYEKMFWKYAANLQENTHAELWYPPQTSNYIRKETLAQVFSCGFWEIFKNTFI